MAFCYSLAQFLTLPSSLSSRRHLPLTLAGAASSGNQQNFGNPTQAFTLVEKGSTPTSTDVMKLFNDVQQNMLYLNKQRINAVEELENVEREKELLTAKLRLLEAEVQASEAECEVLHRQLEGLKSKAGNSSEVADRDGAKWFMDILPVFGELLLRLDSMVLTSTISSSQACLLKGLVMNKDTQAAHVFSSLRTKDDKELASGLLPLLDPNRRYGVHVIHVSTELDPIAKCGALGTHIMNLSRALQRRGNLVELILPKYMTTNLDEVQCLRETPTDFHSFFDGQWHKNKIWTGIVRGIAVTLIESFHPGGFFIRDHLYGYSDDFERFSYFCRAALDYILKTGKHPDILHLHNWQTAMVAPLFWDVFAGQGLGGTHILFNCDDFKNQCLEEPAKLSLCGLDPGRLYRADRLQDNVQPGLVNVLKGGIIYSNKVTTMSPLYPLDATTRDQGHGLETTILEHRTKFVTINNGVDKSVWNPLTDEFLPSTYSFENLHGKAICKSHLKQQIGVAGLDLSAPLIGCIARQVTEAEAELIRAALISSELKEFQFVFIGDIKSPRVQAVTQGLQSELKEGRACIVLEYNDPLAHLVLAASDIVICVSSDEPIMPLIAMQYGSVPVTRQQEGSNAKIIGADLASFSLQANAFTFRSSTAHELRVALSRAIQCMISDPQRWNTLMQNGMSIDVSWDSACVEDYIAAYWSIKQL